MSSQTTNYNFVLPAGIEAYDISVQNQNWQKAETALSIQSNRESMMKISCTSLQDMKDKLTTMFANIAVETAIELVLVTSAFDIFPPGTHSFTFHKLAGNYWWGYGYVNNKIATISNANGTWYTKEYAPTKATVEDITNQTNVVSGKIYFIRSGGARQLVAIDAVLPSNATALTLPNLEYLDRPTISTMGFFAMSTGSMLYIWARADGLYGQANGVAGATLNGNLVWFAA